MILRFSSGSDDPGQCPEEALLGVDDDEVDPRRGDEVLLDLLGLARPQQPVVDEHAGELVADRLLHEGRRHRRVHPAGQPADDPGLAHLGAHARDEVVDDVGGGPLPREARTPDEEVLEHLLAERRVQHLGVPLDAVEPALVVLEAGHRGARRRRRDRHPGRGLRDRVAVAHPHRLLVGLPVEQGRRRVEDVRRRRPELRQPGLLDRAAERLRHGLEPVAHAEHRHPGLQQGRVERGRTLLVDRRRPARQDHRGRVLGQHVGHRHRVGDDLAEAAGLAHPPRDELGVLGPEVDDEHRAVGETHRFAPLDDDVVGVVVLRHTGLRAGGVAHPAKATGARPPDPPRPHARHGARPRTTGTARTRRA